MANTRIIDEVSGLVGNGVSVGGATQIATSQSYVENINSDQDGAEGPVDPVHSGMQVDVTVNSTDVTKLIPLLISSPTNMVFFGKQSGASTYGKGTIVAPVFHSGSLQAGTGQYATMTAQAKVRFAAAADDFGDVEQWVLAQTVPTFTNPLRLYRIKSIVHGSLSPLHDVGFGLTIPGRLLTDFGDGDLGMTAVDRVGWGLPQVTLEIRDSAKHATINRDIATSLLLNGTEDLVVTLQAGGGVADQVLTLLNCVFRSKGKSTSRGYTTHSLSGVLNWRDPVDPFTMRDLDNAIAANRLINFA